MTMSSKPVMTNLVMAITFRINGFLQSWSCKRRAEPGIGRLLFGKLLLINNLCGRISGRGVSKFDNRLHNGRRGAAEAMRRIQV